ncbi:hypothetical protein QQG74_16660 [Micromonospora sp. FIMYZ51]|uniref:hypothetical protein n=1 Tax=Micromonospora sp. FIMYZ51 TaxID=3051832 RepID=UPI0031201A68
MVEALEVRCDRAHGRVGVPSVSDLAGAGAAVEWVRVGGLIFRLSLAAGIKAGV